MTERTEGASRPTLENAMALLAQCRARTVFWSDVDALLKAYADKPECPACGDDCTCVFNGKRKPEAPEAEACNKRNCVHNFSGACHVPVGILCKYHKDHPTQQEAQAQPKRIEPLDLLKIRNIIATREMNTAQANLELSNGGWLCDHAEYDRVLQADVDEIIERLGGEA